MSKPSFVPYLKAIFAVVVWAAAFIATKLALQEAAPSTVVWLRFGLGVLVLGVTVFARKQFAWPRGREWGYFALLGFIGITFHQWLQSNGLVTAQATSTAWIISTTPIFIALLGWLFLRERLGWLSYAGIFLAVLGVLLVISKGDWQAVFTGKFATSGDILILLSAPNWAVFSILSRQGLQKQPAARLIFWVMLLGWLLSSPIFFLDRGFTDILSLTWKGWSCIGILGVLGAGLAYTAWFDALQELPAAQVGGFLYLEPLVTMLTAAVVLGEQINLTSVLGGGIILLGVWLVNRPRKEKPPTPQTPASG